MSTPEGPPLRIKHAAEDVGQVNGNADICTEPEIAENDSVVLVFSPLAFIVVE